jgi:hypothetical protein
MAGEFEDETTLGRPGEAMLAFGHPEFVQDGSEYVRIPVRASASGLVVESSIELAPWTQHASIQGLIAYVDDLDRSWRGWPGEKEWSDAERDVTLSAAYRSTLAATLTVTVRHPPLHGDHAGEWFAKVVVPFEPAAVARLAEWLRDELSQAPWEVPPLPPRG